MLLRVGKIFLFGWTLFTLFLPCHAFSRVHVSAGSGVSAIYSGRVTPVLHGAVDFSHWAATFYASGVKTKIYYHTAYQMGLYYLWSPGKLWWGEFEGGIGLGGFYAQHGYRLDPNSSNSEKNEDIVIGPSVKVRWAIAGPLFLTVESLFGITGSTIHLLLEFQQITNAAVGIRI